MTRPPPSSNGAPGAPSGRVGVIGRGRIAAPVIDALRRGAVPGWTLAGVLVRGDVGADAIDRATEGCTNDPAAFFARPLDLVLEAAGPRALAQHGEAALRTADVWTVSAAALADDTLRHALERAALAHDHRLRVLPGALAGLDGVAMTAEDPAQTLDLLFELPSHGAQPAPDFEGSVREAALRHPDETNVAVAAALAGPGLDAARIRMVPATDGVRRLGLAVRSRHADLQLTLAPRVAPGVHPVAASLLAALRQARRPIWVG